ncbi:uncharacterized protein LOC111600274 [Drosophila hydei]|uniref:Uncharacterized protein LOC111600274 n=1 Tax=Drosophila hydei TaxID=7224 RepID=A0A6J1LZQ0_DROHY|nr:uncharacterized protein LOC111600274 [Drosophila hydei]
MDAQLKPRKCPKSGFIPTSCSDRVLRSRARIERQETKESTAIAKAVVSRQEISKSALLIYLDLSQPTAIVCSEPVAAAAVDEDIELKKRLDTFLGLNQARRLLYTPWEAFDDLEDNDVVQDKDVRPELPKLERQLLSRVGLELKLLPSLKQKLFVENVQRLNANYFQQQTPRQLKEPIDLSELPDEEQRTRICREHKAQVEQIQKQEQDLYCYSFLSSLSPETPLSMCHPLSLTYRQQSFDNCKAALAKSLFGLLNHLIFHCGLRQRIEWQQLRRQPGCCVLSIGTDLRRRARFKLSPHIRETGALVETLLHEMCHAAAFVYNGEMAHGLNTCKWAYRAKSLLPQLPLISDCAASCTYTCRLCRRSACGNIRFRGKQQLLRCFYCQFELFVSDCSADSAHELRLTAQPDTSYTIYIRTHYMQCNQRGHSSKMRSLNAQYSRTTKL